MIQPFAMTPVFDPFDDGSVNPFNGNVPAPPALPPVGSLVTMPSTPQVLPPISVSGPGGHLFDIVPKVISTESTMSTSPWVWLALAVGAYLIFSRRGRR